jgi:hypothetical protein
MITLSVWVGTLPKVQDLGSVHGQERLLVCSQRPFLIFGTRDSLPKVLPHLLWVKTPTSGSKRNIRKGVTCKKIIYQKLPTVQKAVI